MGEDCSEDPRRFWELERHGSLESSDLPESEHLWSQAPSGGVEKEPEFQSSCWSVYLLGRSSQETV